MTTLPSYHDYGLIDAHLRVVRSRWRGANIATAISALVAGVLAIMLLIGLVEGLLHLNTVGRILLLATSIGVLAAVVVLGVFKPLLRGYTNEQVARYVEERLPELNNALINSVQLASDEHVVSGLLTERAIAESARNVSHFNLADAVEYRPFYRRGSIAVGLAVLLTIFSLLLPGRLTNALTRVLRPTDASVAVVGGVGKIEVSPGDAEVGLGEPFEVHVRVTNSSGGKLPEGHIEWYPRTEAGEKCVEPLAPITADSFSYSMKAVEAGFRYCVRVGDSRSGMFTVTVIDKPFVENVDLTYQYPPYTGLETKVETASRTGNIEAPEGTSVRLRVHPSRTVASGQVRFDDGLRPINLELEPDGLALGGLLRVTRNVGYSFYLQHDETRGCQEGTRRRIHVVLDKPPVVSIIEPPTDTAVAPGATVEVALRVGDDYGITKAILWMKRNDETEVPVKTWDRFENRRDDTVFHKILLDKSAFRVGEKVSFRAQALDNCALIRPDAPVNGDGPTFQLSTSNVRTIYIRDPKAERDKLAEDVRGWQSRIDEILKLQKKANTTVDELKTNMGRNEFRTASDGVVADQRVIQKKTSALVVDMGELNGDVLRTVRTALAMLARNDMIAAIAQAEKLSSLSGTGRTIRPQADLLSTQARIIKLLTEIMGVLPAVVAEQLGQADPERPTNMAADAKDKWKALAEKLKEFADQQKKVIEDTTDLFKKDVDNFTAADDEKLKELAAIQDEWAKFLSEAHKDLSKIPDQDFSNPALLKELLEIVSDVEKAADAITRKITEFAVPLEQAGLENAEEMTTHIEKWLPDSADRERWKMEEPLEDLDAPMAELPKELEDLVGELMEEEEDLFEEVEDTSSAWSDSLDKGAGWDTLDGPISNMSAQGVTGNRLPNSSEIGGRSGEGRTGKSSGEMVGAEAVGKGGRRTPTRLTSDPYEKGEVKDSSTDGSGGATGGGKLSGAGAEGLAGPVPPALARKMKRLAGKQAALRNKAERVKVGFKVLNYPHADVDRVITIMKTVEDDLKNFRYNNVLRQRQILLKGLRASQLMVKRELTVRNDPTATLPPEIQREILDSTDLAVPPEYEDLVRKYYESLAETE